MDQFSFLEPEPLGRRAHISGKTAEDTLAGTLQSLRYGFTRQHLLGDTIYRTPRYVDFFVHSCRGFSGGLVIELKWQEVLGTVDEKFPYLVENIRYSKMPTLVVLGGGGCRFGACEYMRRQIDGLYLIDVFGLEPCITWLRKRANT